MALPQSSSPVQQADGTAASQQQPQHPEGAQPLPELKQQQQQQQNSKGGMHLSELRYELGPELKQVSGPPHRPSKPGISFGSVVPCLCAGSQHKFNDWPVCEPLCIAEAMLSSLPESKRCLRQGEEPAVLLNGLQGTGPRS